MNVLIDFFENIATFREFVPFVASDIELDELNPSGISARKQIQGIITPEIWKMILADQASETAYYLKVAYGNLTMHKAIIFTVLAKRMSGGGAVYKHELETMRRQYIDNYYNAMDSLIRELDTNEAYTTAWHATPDYLFIDSLRIQTTAEFNSLYGIDMSYLFFFRTLSIQREVLDEMIGGYFVSIEGREPDFETKLKRALAFMVISLAVTRFDIAELPATIRSLFDEQKASRNGSTEYDALKDLATSLQAKAMDTIKSIELALSKPEHDNIDPDTTFNRESDKYYLMS